MATVYSFTVGRIPIACRAETRTGSIAPFAKATLGAPPDNLAGIILFHC